VLRRFAIIGMLVGLGGTLLIDRMAGNGTACRFALGFGTAFVVVWAVEAWEHRD
jgi:hypothetical protein